MKRSTTKKTFFLLAGATFMIAASGCGCCKGMFGQKTQTVARPVYTQCAPTCTSGCDACSSGGITTYGMPPVTTFPVESTISTVPSGI